MGWFKSNFLDVLILLVASGLQVSPLHGWWLSFIFWGAAAVLIGWHHWGLVKRLRPQSPITLRSENKLLENPVNEAFVYHVAILWRLMDRDGAYYFDFQVHVFNGSHHNLFLATKIEGGVAYDSALMMLPPQVNEKPLDYIGHAQKSYVQLRQDFTVQAPIVQHLHEKTGEQVVLHFGNLRIWAEYRDQKGRTVARFPLELPARVQTPPVSFYKD